MRNTVLVGVVVVVLLLVGAGSALAYCVSSTHDTPSGVIVCTTCCDGKNPCRTSCSYRTSKS